MRVNSANRRISMRLSQTACILLLGFAVSGQMALAGEDKVCVRDDDGREICATPPKMQDWRKPIPHAAKADGFQCDRKGTRYRCERYFHGKSVWGWCYCK